MPDNPRWVSVQTAGRTLRFVDTAHHESDAPARIAAAFAGSEIRASPMSLRDIFLTLARSSTPSAPVEAR
jgi:hypothetical protein